MVDQNKANMREQAIAWLHRFADEILTEHAYQELASILEAPPRVTAAVAEYAGAMPAGWDLIQKDDNTAWCVEGPWFNTRQEARIAFFKMFPPPSGSTLEDCAQDAEPIPEEKLNEVSTKYAARVVEDAVMHIRDAMDDARALERARLRKAWWAGRHKERQESSPSVSETCECGKPARVCGLCTENVQRASEARPVPPDYDESYREDCEGPKSVPYGSPQRTNEAPTQFKKVMQVTGEFPHGETHLCWQGSHEEHAKISVPFECYECGLKARTREDLDEWSHEWEVPLPAAPRTTTAEEDQATLRRIADIVSNEGLDHGGNPDAIVAAVQHLVMLSNQPGQCTDSQKPPCAHEKAPWAIYVWSVGPNKGRCTKCFLSDETPTSLSSAADAFMVAFCADDISSALRHALDMHTELKHGAPEARTALPDSERVLKLAIFRVGGSMGATEQDLQRADRFQIRRVFDGHHVKLQLVEDT